MLELKSIQKTFLYSFKYVQNFFKLFLRAVSGQSFKNCIIFIYTLGLLHTFTTKRSKLISLVPTLDIKLCITLKQIQYMFGKFVFIIN